MHERGVPPKIAVGHDFRHYSLGIKQALMLGLVIEVLDIGLALSPTAYFAQFHLDCPGVAMVTASHNTNGWTGVKMGIEPPLTFGPDEMARLKEIVLNAESTHQPGGSYRYVEGVRQAFIDDLVEGVKLKNKIKVVAACGNGTAGVLHAMADACKKHGADVALGFDGDGDRCGVVDNEGEEIFADKVGVMLARDLSALHPNAQFVADVKSTGLFATDPVLLANGAKTDYYKTGHSYIKRRSKELNALVGFEKSGHYFFNAPIGRGYDCGLTSAIAILQMLDRNPDKSMADLRRALPKTWGSPTMSPYCADEVKYGVVDRIIAEIQAAAKDDETILGQKIVDVNTVNGVRMTLEDGTWGLMRASSNTPNLVVVVESPASEENMIGMFREIERRLAKYDEIGEFDQKI